MEKIAAFVQEHIADDTAKLILSRAKWPEIDMDLAVACIESRRKLKNKVQDWYCRPELIFPARLSAEQCSSSATATYKARLAAEIGGEDFKIADLTGGLGVDSWYFSKCAAYVLYNEMQEILCSSAKHNFKSLNAENISVSNLKVEPESENLNKILTEFKPDIVFMDPARRSETGKKVFLIEDCSPDVLTLRTDIFAHCRHILLKLSPMADITMVCTRLGSTCREVHVVAYGGECKELLIWMDREWDGDFEIKAVELSADYPSSEEACFSFKASDEKAAKITFGTPEQSGFLFEPGKAMMKSGCFNLISERLELAKLGVSTHYYITSDPDTASALKMLGKVYEIISSQPLDKRSIKAVGKEYPHSEVTARNIPMESEALRKKLGVTSGDDAHIFGLKSDKSGNLLLVTKRF